MGICHQLLALNYLPKLGTKKGLGNRWSRKQGLEGAHHLWLWTEPCAACLGVWLGGPIFTSQVSIGLEPQLCHCATEQTGQVAPPSECCWPSGVLPSGKGIDRHLAESRLTRFIRVLGHTRLVQHCRAPAPPWAPRSSRRRPAAFREAGRPRGSRRDPRTQGGCAGGRGGRRRGSGRGGGGGGGHRATGGGSARGSGARRARRPAG
jgi:uncharacterized membrane protein YgcG